MNAALLNALSAAISDNPIHVLQLRKVVVALAMSGRLDQTEGSIGRDEILALLDDVKRRLIAQRFIAKQKPVVAISNEQLPEDFSDPSKFISLGQVARVEKGKTGIQQAKAGHYPLVVTASERLSADHFDFDTAAAIIPLVSSTGHGNASINRLHYQEGRFALGTILAAVLPHEPALFSARFLFEYLSAFKDELLVSRMSGTANVTLTLGRIEEVPIPLVPPAIQRQVDQLMALCDELEAARTEREAKRDRLTVASLARLHTPDPETFRDDARFALDALPALTARPDQIKQLRQTVLNLAVRGKLVPQDPADEPAEVLLKRVENKRSELLKAGYPNAGEARTQLKKLTEQNVPDGLEVLPKGWAWATLQQCSLLVIDCKNKTAPYASSGIRLVRTTNVRNGQLNAYDQKYVSDETYRVWSARCQPEPGDILITREAPMGEVCLIPNGETICLGQRMMLARLVPETISNEFMLYSLRDPQLMDRVQDKPIGATVQHLRVGGVETLLVPLPPIAEQHRIVAKVDELMALCDQLETSLTSADEARKKLLDALLAEALTPVDVEVLQEAAE